jgi:copper homeostasis protein
MQGLDEIRRTIEQADGRIEVLPGGGIRIQNIPEVVRHTGADQVHLFIKQANPDRSAAGNPAVHFGVDPPKTETEYFGVDEAGVRQARELLNSLAG